ATRLSDIDRRKNEFLAMLAHELRTPLAPIHHGIQVIRLAGADAQTINSVTAIMERQVNHLVGLIDDLLDVNRISLGKIGLHCAQIELATVVTDAAQSARPFSERMEQELTVKVPTEPIW